MEVLTDRLRQRLIEVVRNGTKPAVEARPALGFGRFQRAQAGLAFTCLGDDNLLPGHDPGE